jgi:hypothetical protein
MTMKHHSAVVSITGGGNEDFDWCQGCSVGCTRVVGCESSFRS